MLSASQFALAFIYLVKVLIKKNFFLNREDVYSDKQFQAEKGEQIAAEPLEAKLIDTFGALPSCEQEDLLKTLEELMQTLTTVHKTAAPLIDMVSLPYTESWKRRANIIEFNSNTPWNQAAIQTNLNWSKLA